MLKLAVIGDPISHSLSPIVHGAVLKQLDIPYEYLKIQVKKGELAEVIRFAKEEKVEGFNLTMPHKVDILPYLTYIDKDAEQLGSVNTVKVVDGKLYGFNTDADGYAESIKMLGRTFKNKNIVFLGAGGVVRALSQKSAIDGAKSISVVNRNKSEAEKICEITRGIGVTSMAYEFDEENIDIASVECDILINATPLGMNGTKNDFEYFGFLKLLPKECLVSDLIYNPQKTTLLKRAEECGLVAINGLGMLIFQAVIADEIYSGIEIDKKQIYPIVCDSIRQCLDI